MTDLPASMLRSLAIVLGAMLPAAVMGCQRPVTDTIQGYVEGEYVYVASPRAGQLERLETSRGTSVKKGDILFALDAAPELAARLEAQRRLDQASAAWEDAKKGRRPSEIQSLEAELKQAQSAVVFSERETMRVERLVGTGSVTEEELDRVQTNREQNRQRVARLQADLRTARLGAREDEIAAAEAHMHALAAALTQAEWALEEKRQAAPMDALTFDTLYEQGEWVPAGSPVVALLPPENIKVRAYVPETQIGNLNLGDPAQVAIDGVPQPVAGNVSFISPQAEFTPPVIYSRESREKLVFLIEIRFDRATSSTLHPGQPVDVTFPKP